MPVPVLERIRRDIEWVLFGEFTLPMLWKYKMHGQTEDLETEVKKCPTRECGNLGVITISENSGMRLVGICNCPYKTEYKSSPKPINGARYSVCGREQKI